MKYTSNWDNFTKKDFEKIKESYKKGNLVNDYFGRIYVGQLCFDVLALKGDEENGKKINISLDCYVPYEDTGYGYKDLEDGSELPYDYAGGLDIEISNKSFEDFVKEADYEMESYIRDYDTDGHEYSLVEKAKNEVFDW